MTITARNRLIKSGAVASVLFSLLTVAAFVRLCLDTERDIPENLIRFIDLPDNMFCSFNFYAAAGAVLALTLAGTLTLLRLYFLFEKTPSIEITFFSAGLIAVSAECIRMLAPFFNVWEMQPVMMVLISRFVLFIRAFFVLTVLAAAIFSLEKTIQKPGTLLFFMSAAAFFAAQSMPINYSALTSTFFLMPGYSGALSAVVALLLLIAFFSFLVQAKTHGDPEYYKISAGCFCISAGWVILGICDNWAFFVAGIVLLFAGIPLYLLSLHKYYLWK